MTTIQIIFENTNSLKSWISSLDEHLKESNLDNPPTELKSVFWRSNSNSTTYKPLANDSIFRRIPNYDDGIYLRITKLGGESKFELSVGRPNLINPDDVYLPPFLGFEILMSNLKSIPFKERKLACGTIVKDLLPSPIRFTIANFPTYVSDMVGDLLLQREDEINDRMYRYLARGEGANTKEKLLEFFSSYGILAFVLNHVYWSDIGLEPTLKPIYDHWKSLGHSLSPCNAPRPELTQDVAVTGFVNYAYTNFPTDPLP